MAKPLLAEMLKKAQELAVTAGLAGAALLMKAACAGFAGG